MGLTDGRIKNWQLIQEPQFLSNFRFLDSTVQYSTVQFSVLRLKFGRKK